MTASNLNQGIVKRAKSDFGSTMKSATFQVFAMFFGVLVSASTALVPSSLAIQEKIGLVVLSGFLAYGLLLTIMYGFHLFRAPFRQRNELRTCVTALKAQIDDLSSKDGEQEKEPPLGPEYELRQLLTKGQHLEEAVARKALTVPSGDQQLSDWTDTVYEKMVRAGFQDDAVTFSKSGRLGVTPGRIFLLQLRSFEKFVDRTYDQSDPPG